MAWVEGGAAAARTDGVGLVSASRLGKGTKRRLDELAKGEMEWPHANRIQETVLKRERFFHYVLSVHLFFGKRIVRAVTCIIPIL